MLYKQGNPYRFMLREYYPHLRKAICKIEYDVQNFNIEQAKVLIHSRPQNLSLNEIYLVALTYKMVHRSLSNYLKQPLASFLMIRLPI